MTKPTIAFCLALALPATAAAAEQAPPASATVADLGWMAGSWAGRDGALEMEEHWTAPKGGAMISIHRDVKNGKMVSFELARIEETAGGLVFYASPGGRPPVPFKMVRLGPRRVVFENLDHDFPQRILYWLEPDGSLGARVEGTPGGKPDSMEWRWRPSSLK